MYRGTMGRVRRIEMTNLDAPCRFRKTPNGNRRLVYRLVIPGIHRLALVGDNIARQ